MGRVRLVIEYDGAPFAGWQKQPGKITVQGRLEEALSTVVRQPVKLRGSGRTDAGVHAKGQVADVDVPDDTDLHRLGWSVNALLRPGIAVKLIDEVAEDFDARRHATLRTYSYTVLCRSFPSPLLDGRCWWVADPLDFPAMEQASRLLVGERDFSSFVAAGGSSTTKTTFIREACWELVAEEPGLARMTISADSFLYHMVRLIVGTLVWVGKGKLSIDGFEEVLAAKDVRRAAPMAPARGLVLEEVRY